MYDEQHYFRRALDETTFMSAIRNIVPAVLDRVVDFLTDRSRKAWCRGWLHPLESAAWPKFGATAPIVRENKQQVFLDPSGSKIGLPAEGLAGRSPMLDFLPVAAKQLYSGYAMIGKPREEE